MSRSARTPTPAGRDAGLRRLRILNRVLVGAAVAGTGLLTDVAAQAFPGHKRVVRPPVAAQPSPSPAARPAHRRPAHRRHSAGRRHAPAAHRALTAPAQPPASSTSAQATTTPAPQATTPSPQATTPAPQATTPAPQATVPQPQPQPQPQPAPVVSGGS
jgi:hypothetical protein